MSTIKVLFTDPGCLEFGNESLKNVKNKDALVYIDLPVEIFELLRTEPEFEMREPSASHMYWFGERFDLANGKLLGRVKGDDTALMCAVDPTRLTPFNWDAFCERVVCKGPVNNVFPHMPFVGESIGAGYRIYGNFVNEKMVGIAIKVG